MAGDHAHGLFTLLSTQQLTSQESHAAGEPASVESEEDQNKTFSSPDLPPLPADAVLLPGPGMLDLLL